MDELEINSFSGPAPETSLVFAFMLQVLGEDFIGKDVDAVTKNKVFLDCLDVMSPLEQPPAPVRTYTPEGREQVCFTHCWDPPAPRSCLALGRCLHKVCEISARVDEVVRRHVLLRMRKDELRWGFSSRRPPCLRRAQTPGPIEAVCAGNRRAFQC